LLDEKKETRTSRASKVPILKEVTSEKCNSVELNTFSTYFVTIAITPKSEDKYVEKVFNSTELHFSEVTSFKIGTLEALLVRVSFFSSNKFKDKSQKDF
jgi:hypothetical protein